MKIGKNAWWVVLASLLWMATSALAMLLLFMSRNFVVAILGALGADPWRWGIVDKGLFVLGGLAVLCIVVATDIWYRNGLRNGTLLKRAARVAGVEVLVLFVFHLAVTLARGGAPAFSSGTFLLALEAGTGLALLVVSIVAKASKGLSPG